MENFKDNIRNLIAKAKTDKAIDLFFEYLETNKDQDLYNMVLMKSGEYAEFKKHETLGLISSSNASTKRNQINYTILELLDEIKDSSNYFQNNQNKKEEMFNLIDLNKFLKDWKHGDVYYKTSENFDKVLAISKLAYNDAKKCFEDDLDLTKEIVQVWELANKKANQTRNWSDVNELIEYLISYAESKNEASEVDSTMTKEQELSNIAMTCLPDQATNAIFEYLKYQCSFLHNDKQIVIEGKWSKAQQPDKLKNVWTKSTYIRNLRETFVTGFKYL